MHKLYTSLSSIILAVRKFYVFINLSRSHRKPVKVFEKTDSGQMWERRFNPHKIHFDLKCDLIFGNYLYLLLKQLNLKNLSTFFNSI